MTDKKYFMRLALTTQKRFGKPVPIVPFADWDFYYTSAELEWKPDGDPQGTLINVYVPTGFVTDLASIPNVFWSLLPPTAAYSYPAIIHDYLYWHQPCDRTEADSIFRTAMQELKVPSAKTVIICEAVRYAGGFAWSANDAAKKRGEKRVLKKFPTDIMTTWAAWKLQADVFV
jgi:hypothetical protein